MRISDWSSDVCSSDLKKSAPRIRIQHRKSSSDQSFDGSRPYFAGAEAALGRKTPGPVSFTVTHDAGTLACSGTLTGAFDGTGKIGSASFREGGCQYE